MHRILTTALLPLFCTIAAAQTTFTSPRGLDTTEGNASFFASTNRRYQSIDATQLGNVAIIKSWALRRNGTSASRAGASTVDLTLTMGETDMAVVSAVFDNNLQKNRKAVFPKAKVNWPDWGTASPTPAPFDLRVPFANAGTYVYLGQNALVWDLSLENGTNTGNSFDRDYTGYRGATGASIGTGCAGFGQTTEMQSNGPALKKYGMRFRVGTDNGPPSTPTLASLALTDSNLTVPGLCTRLHAVPLAILPIGISNSSGVVCDTFYNVPFDAALNGFTLVTQAFAPSASGLVLSNARSSTMPTVTSTTGHEACYLWASGGNAVCGISDFVFTGGTIICQYGT